MNRYVIAMIMARTAQKHSKTMSKQEESDDEVVEVSKQQESGSEVILSDRISSLPDSLLHHILSFLPTREVVATSLLSKRWRPLWHSTPTFDFGEERVSSHDFFIQFVDAVLLMEDLKPIKKFRLNCRRFCARQKDYKCLANLLSGCALLEELVIMKEDDDDEEEEKYFTLNTEKLEHLVSANVPSFLITSKAFTNVTFLQLDVDKSPVRDIPTFDNLTHLEISHLDDERLNWIVECLQSCPKLEIFVINEIDDDFDGEVALMEPIPDVPQCLTSQLKEFTLREYEGREWEFQIARYIMEKARVLRTIFICCGYMDANDEYESLNMLALCPRGSQHCRLLFK